MTNLKTILAALALLVFYSANSFSQSTSMGIEGGINLANISTTATFNNSTKTGFMVGVFADIGVSRIVSIKPGVRYILKGYSGQFQQVQGLNWSETYSYIEMPLLIKAKVPLKHVKPFVELGPTLGIQLSASSEISFNGQVQSGDEGANYNAIDFGLYFGSGAEFTVAPNIDLLTGFGYSLGLTNIAKNTTGSVKSNGFQITAGVKFGL